MRRRSAGRDSTRFVPRRSLGRRSDFDNETYSRHGSVLSNPKDFCWNSYRLSGSVIGACGLVTKLRIPFVRPVFCMGSSYCIWANTPCTFCKTVAAEICLGTSPIKSLTGAPAILFCNFKVPRRSAYGQPLKLERPAPEAMAAAAAGTATWLYSTMAKVAVTRYVPRIMECLPIISSDRQEQPWGKLREKLES